MTLLYTLILLLSVALAVGGFRLFILYTYESGKKNTNFLRAGENYTGEIE